MSNGINPVNHNNGSAERLPESLKRLKNRTFESPPKDYFENLERRIFDRIDEARVIPVGRSGLTSWLRIAAVFVLAGALTWFFMSRSVTTEEVEWVFTEEQLFDFLEQHYEELDKATIYAAAENEHDLYLRISEQSMQQDALDYIINDDESLDILLFEDH